MKKKTEARGAQKQGTHRKTQGKNKEITENERNIGGGKFFFSHHTYIYHRLRLSLSNHGRQTKKKQNNTDRKPEQKPRPNFKRRRSRPLLRWLQFQSHCFYCLRRSEQKKNKREHTAETETEKERSSLWPINTSPPLSLSSSSSTRQTLRETRRTREAKKTRGRESKKEAG